MDHSDQAPVLRGLSRLRTPFSLLESLSYNYVFVITFGQPSKIHNLGEILKSKTLSWVRLFKGSKFSTNPKQYGERTPARGFFSQDGWGVIFEDFLWSHEKWCPGRIKFRTNVKKNKIVTIRPGKKITPPAHWSPSCPTWHWWNKFKPRYPEFWSINLKPHEGSKAGIWTLSSENGLKFRCTPRWGHWARSFPRLSSFLYSSLFALSLP